MTLPDAVTWLYALVPVASAIGWIPQIYRLARRPALGAGLSVVTWGVWTVTAFIGLLYGIVVLKDLLVSVFFLVNFLGQVIVFGFALAARFRSVDEGTT